MYYPEEKKLIIAILLILFVFSLFSQVAQAQIYQVTEQQLQKLETEFQSLKDKNMKLSGLNTDLKSQVKNLTELSTARQNTIATLMSSCSELENKLSAEHQQQAVLMQKLNEQKLKTEKMLRYLIISACLNIILSLSVLIFVYFLFKKK